MSNSLVRTSNGSAEGEVSNCVSNLIHAFTNGLNIFKHLRERRRRRKHRKQKIQLDPPSSAELQLSNSLRRGPMDIQSSYENHYSRAGGQFAKGDAIAHASLAETLVKLNTGLVGIIAAFLNHDSKSNHLNLDYKSLTSLSDASRTEAIESLNQLYQRLSQSQLQVYRIGACPRCGSMKHQSCSGVGTGNAHSSSGKGHSDKRKHTGSRSRSIAPIVARVPVKSSSHTQLVVVRPRTTRKGSSSSSSSTKSQSTALSSPYASPLGSPLPQYTPMDPFPAQKAPTAKVNAPTGRRRASSIDGSRPTTWPHTRPDNTIALQPAPPSKLPAPRKSPLPKEKHTPSPEAGPLKRRLDKATPSTYTFASDSTKLGEIPQRNWTTPWNYAEAERLNAEALANGHSSPAVETKPKKKGLFKFLRRGTGESS